MSDTETTTQSAQSGLKTGRVGKISGNKTIRVDVDNLTKHPLYHKYVHKRTRLAVHDPENTAVVGDTVEIVPCRPISKNKTWRLVRVISHDVAV
ncbi:MAG: 30S ribosomal protein S17 [Phycisphaerales bacterium]|jgi:small subunit ribosomal protein S17|nr:30S ribosomal protein S17 [Phycisphaerales bacterium]